MNSFSLIKSFIIKPLFLVFFISISYISFGQYNRYSTINQDTVVTTEGIVKVETISINGKRLEVIRTINGLKNGIQEKYNRKGKLQEKAMYRNGNIDGEVIVFDYYGRLLEKKNYKYSKSKGHSLLQGKYEKYSNTKQIVSANYKDSLLDGKYKEYKNNLLSISAKYKAGLLIGTKSSYNRKGNLMAVQKYKIITEDGVKKSVLTGKATYYHFQGNLQSVGKYVNGKKEGIWKSYYQREGGLESEVNYKNDKINGRSSYYYRNGNLRSRGAQYFTNDKYGHYVLDGKNEQWNSEGILTSIAYYDMGKKTGYFKSFNPEGTAQQMGKYQNNLKIGGWIYFDNEGDIMSITNFIISKKNEKDVSVKDGIEKRWKNKTLISKYNYKKGVMHGRFFNYHQNGQLANSGNYIDGLMEGEYYEYYENGKIKSQKTYEIIESSPGYKKSKIVGWDRRFDKNGSLSSKFFMDSLGNVISTIKYNKDLSVQASFADIVVNHFSDGKIMSMVLGKKHYASFAQYFYTNGKTRVIRFHSPETETNYRLAFSNKGELLYTNSINRTGNNNPDSLLPSAELVSKYTKAVGLDFIPNKFYTDSIKNGKYILRYANGNIMAEMEFENDIPHGIFACYDAISGDTLTFKTYVQGNVRGYFVSNVGRIQRGVILANGKYKWIEDYYTNGVMSEKSVYDNDNKRIQQIKYYENGNLKSRYNTITGNSATYFDEGSVSTITEVKGKRRTELNYFPKSKQLRYQHFYLNKLKDSLWIEYYESGQIRYSLHYKKGMLQEDYIQYNKDGSPRFVGKYKDNKKFGKWLRYRENKVDTSFYENGKIIVEEPKTKCGCIDTAEYKFGNVYTLDYYLEYDDFKHYQPSYVKGIDSNDYHSIFYSRSYSNRGSYSFDMLLFDVYSFNIPADEQIKITINPCYTNGFVSKVHLSAYNQGDFSRKSVSINPKRISVELLKGPLKNPNSENKNFTALFDVSVISYSIPGKLEFEFAKNLNPCFSEGLINNYLTIDIIRANPLLFENPGYSPLKLNKNELSHFFGFRINEAILSFDYKANNTKFRINAKSDYILAGGNFVSGKIQISCKKIGDDKYKISEDGKAKEFSASLLKNQWRRRGFTRLSTIYDNRKQELVLSFYVK